MSETSLPIVMKQSSWEKSKRKSHSSFASDETKAQRQR